MKVMNYYNQELLQSKITEFVEDWGPHRPLSIGPDREDKTCKQSTFKVIISILTIINPR